jgi:cellulose synthase/poly-beta-1,6-N-acetylglucosamine synthase-like glycosyltransferase
MLLLELVISAAALLLLMPICVLAAEVVAALATDTVAAATQQPRPRAAVLMPAHDEALTIGETVRALLPQLGAADCLLVVADNCSDETGSIATANGAEVIVRTDPDRRGKGYALDFGVRHLERDPPQVVLIVDADCRLADGSVDRLVRFCAAATVAVQARYLMQAPAGAGTMVRIAEFACLLKNWVRPLGLRRLGFPCQLLGTGMAFPWGQLRSATLATGHIVEDLKLGLELAASGAAPLFCPNAEVTSSFPTSEEGFKTQRTRWEHGYLAVLTQDAPSILQRAVLRRDVRLLAMGLDLCVPPIALLTLLMAGVWAAAAVLYLELRWVLPLAIASAGASLLAVTVFAAWARFGRKIVSLGNLLLAVAYVLWKIPLYGKFLVARQINWVRSKRDQERST